MVFLAPTPYTHATTTFRALTSTSQVCKLGLPNSLEYSVYQETTVAEIATGQFETVESRLVCTEAMISLARGSALLSAALYY